MLLVAFLPTITSYFFPCLQSLLCVYAYINKYITYIHKLYHIYYIYIYTYIIQYTYYIIEANNVRYFPVSLKLEHNS